MTNLGFSAKGVSVCVDLSVGALCDFIVEREGRMLRPLHRAPWIDEPRESLPPDISPGLARLSGDFLCAPFGLNDVDPAPGHGWPANAPWDIVSSDAIDGGWKVRLRLTRTVQGATVDKILTIRDHHPFLYQQHIFAGGSGEVSVAHHPMARMADGGRLSFSPKKFAATPPTSLEPDPARGKYLFAYPAQTDDLTRLPDSNGGAMDLTVYRAADRREDFVSLVEAEHGGPGWTALARNAERDLLLVLKNPIELPITMLWFSNGGRDYAPWNGRHIGVLGIEDGRAYSGHAASIGDNALKRQGVPTSFVLNEAGEVSFRHVIGALPLGNGVAPPTRLDQSATTLTAVFTDGKPIDVPFDGSYLA
ncbi:MAG: hypothetical protein AB7P20_23555 [Rhizobiaceae bacterium]